MALLMCCESYGALLLLPGHKLEPCACKNTVPAVVNDFLGTLGGPQQWLTAINLAVRRWLQLRFDPDLR